MSADLNSVCRLCLIELNTDAWCMFETAQREKWRVSSIMVKCLGLEIYEGDELPQKICNNCRYQLAKTLLFRKKCGNADQRLRKHLRLISNGMPSDLLNSSKPDDCDGDADEFKEYLLYLEEQDKLKLAKEDDQKQQYRNLLTKQMKNEFKLAKEKLRETLENKISFELRSRLEEELRPIIEEELRIQLVEKVRQSLREEFEKEYRKEKLEELLSEMRDFINKKRSNISDIAEQTTSQLTMETPTKADGVLKKGTSVINLLNPVVKNQDVQKKNKIFIINSKLLQYPSDDENSRTICNRDSDEEEIEFHISKESDGITTSYQIKNDAGSSIRVVETSELNEYEGNQKAFKETNSIDLAELEDLNDCAGEDQKKLKQPELKDVNGSEQMDENEMVSNLSKRGNPNYRQNEICSFCPATFCTKKLLQRHMKTHDKANATGYVFQCAMCSLHLSTRSALRRHEILHTGMRPHKCKVCKKSFVQREVLQRHMLVHTGEKPFKCTHCGAGFSQKANLNSHVKRKHLAKAIEFPCELCTKVFSHASGLSRHLLVHDGLKFTCKTCKRQFKDSSSMKRHEKSIHGIKNSTPN